MLRIRRRYVGDYTLTARVFGEDDQQATVTDPEATIIGYGEDIVSTPQLVDGALTVTVPVEDMPLGIYEVRFTGTIDDAPQEWRIPFEIVGDHIVTLAEIRAFDNGAFADSEEFTDDRLRDARLWAEQRIEHERAAGVAFVPRGTKDVLWADGEAELWLTWPRVRAIRSLTIDDVDIDPDTVQARNMSIRRTLGFTGRVEVVYEHGYDHPSQPVKEVALLAAKEYLIRNLGSRATTESTDVGFYRLSIAGEGGRTGIPEVDALIADERMRARGRSVGVA